MGESIAHIISPASAIWCAWTMLGILLCGVLSELFQPGVILQARTSLVVQNERVYKDAPTNFVGQLMISLFRLGVLSMAIYLCCEQVEAFPFSDFWIIFGVTLAVTIVKMVCNACIDFTFHLSRRFGNAYEHYGNILTLVTACMYPLLLILLQHGDTKTNRWVLGSFGVLFLLIWAYRAFRHFVNSPRAIAYLILHFCTIEGLSWVLIYIISNQTISLI